MKSDREFWYRIGQQMKAAKDKHRANELERQHERQSKQRGADINPAIGPRLRAALEGAKNGKAPE